VGSSKVEGIGIKVIVGFSNSSLRSSRVIVVGRNGSNHQLIITILGNHNHNHNSNQHNNNKNHNSKPGNKNPQQTQPQQLPQQLPQQQQQQQAYTSFTTSITTPITRTNPQSSSTYLFYL
jgi:hypothetical protein